MKQQQVKRLLKKRRQNEMAFNNMSYPNHFSDVPFPMGLFTMYL